MRGDEEPVMTPQPLDYISPCHDRPPARWLARSITLLGVLALLASPFIPVRQTRTRIDAVTGTVETQTTWLCGVTFGPTVDSSPLELRLRTSNIPWTRDWRVLGHAHRTVYGNATMRGCGSAPPIIQIRSVLGQFANAATDDQLREFVRVMQSGAEPARTAAINAAGEVAMNAWRSNVAVKKSAARRGTPRASSTYEK
jgi:hypothetical protein